MVKWVVDFIFGLLFFIVVWCVMNCVVLVMVCVVDWVILVLVWFSDRLVSMWVDVVSVFFLLKVMLLFMCVCSV